MTDLFVKIMVFAPAAACMVAASILAAAVIVGVF